MARGCSIHGMTDWDVDVGCLECMTEARQSQSVRYNDDAIRDLYSMVRKIEERLDKMDAQRIINQQGVIEMTKTFCDNCGKDCYGFNAKDCDLVDTRMHPSGSGSSVYEAYRVVATNKKLS